MENSYLWKKGGKCNLKLWRRTEKLITKKSPIFPPCDITKGSVLKFHLGLLLLPDIFKYDQNMRNIYKLK